MIQLYSVQDLSIKLKISVTRIYHHINNKKIIPDFILLQKNGKNFYMFYKKTITRFFIRYNRYKENRVNLNKKMPKL